jgi:hypothetical protein
MRRLKSVPRKSSETESESVKSCSLRQHFSAIIGAPVLGIKKGEGSFLVITFGVASASHELWVYMCDWELRGPRNALIACSETVSAQSASSIDVLNGLHLADIRSNDKQTELCLVFDGEYMLFLDDASDIYGSGSEMLVFFEGGKHVNTFLSPGGVRPRLEDC